MILPSTALNPYPHFHKTRHNQNIHAPGGTNMIYEVRTYRLKPRMVPSFLDAFGEAYENASRKLGTMRGFRR